MFAFFRGRFAEAPTAVIKAGDVAECVLAGIHNRQAVARMPLEMLKARASVDAHAVKVAARYLYSASAVHNDQFDMRALDIACAVIEAFFALYLIDIGAAADKLE